MWESQHEQYVSLQSLQYTTWNMPQCYGLKPCGVVAVWSHRDCSMCMPGQASLLLIIWAPLMHTLWLVFMLNLHVLNHCVSIIVVVMLRQQ